MNKWLKLLTIAAVISVMAVMMIATASAQGPMNNPDAVPQMSGDAFIDVDGDGVCDNYGTFPNAGTQSGNQMNSQQSHGQAGGNGTRAQLHSNDFVDADGDGVCDNEESAAQNRGASR